MRIARLTSLPPAADALAKHASAAGHAFLERWLDEWRSGENRFDAPGELLLGATIQDCLVGVGGLNRDPYVQDPRIGRVRHLYVRDDCRRQGIGRALLKVIVVGGISRFRELRLRTDNQEAALFYEHFGFRSVVDATATHVLTLPELGRTAERE